MVFFSISCCRGNLDVGAVFLTYFGVWGFFFSVVGSWVVKPGPEAKRSRKKSRVAFRLRRARSLENLRNGKQPKHISFLGGIWCLRPGGYPGGRPGPKTLTPSLAAQKNKVFFCADVFDPKARTSTNRGCLRKLSAGKLRADFSLSRKGPTSKASLRSNLLRDFLGSWIAAPRDFFETFWLGTSRRFPRHFWKCNFP